MYINEVVKIMRKKSNKVKQYRAIKTNHAWISIVLFSILLVATAIGVFLAMEAAMEFLTNSKLMSERESIAVMARIYDDEKSSEDKARKMISSFGRDYLILDENDNVIYCQGEDTCTMRKGKLVMLSVEDIQDVYFDQNDEWLEANQDNEVSPSVPRILVNSVVRVYDYYVSHRQEVNQIHGRDESENISEEELYERVTEFYQTHDEDFFAFPVWISMPLSDGRAFVGKGMVYFNVTEVLYIIIIVFAILLLLFLLLILMIVNIAVTGHRQKKVINTFLTDPVTKGHNWTWVTMKLEPRLRSFRYAGKNISVVELVFINYRNFCTCHSLEEGENILCRISDEIKKTLSKREACAHVGTASFAIFLEYETTEQLRVRLRELIKTLENIDVTHKFAFHLGADLEEAQRKENGKRLRRKNFSIENAYNNACMARATLSDVEDSRIAFFDQKLVDEKRWIDAVSERQSKAVENEEFVVYYQPKYDPRTNLLRGCEALIRWDSPDLGFLSPGRFIPIFEKNGFITEIDHYMITHVARDQKAWLDQGLSCVPISVNVSRAHFIESDLAEQIRDLVDQEGTPRNLIEIELTESAFFDDKHAMIQTIQKLKEYGFVVSMDDFGAGYSSLNSLKDMPLDVLKLDADFFRGDTEGGRGEIVVSEAIRLAKNLNMYTVAEGVEDENQVAFLAKHGCDMIQGYYFAKPMPKEEYLERLKTGISERAFEGQSPEAGMLSAENTDPTPEAENVETITDEENASVAADIREVEENQKVEEILEAEEIPELKDGVSEG